MFANSRSVLINGGEFWNTTEQRITIAFEKLQKASSMGATHDSSVRFDPPKCHPNTRVAVLEYIIGWIFGRNDPEALILWLYGPAGAGKSAILQSIAEMCAERKSILASFFFSRNDPKRNTFERFIPTIACQIAIAIPEIRPRIEFVIESDPTIFDKSLATQFKSLIIHPLKDLITSGFFSNPETSPRLVIIDGLDECVDPKAQSMILRTLADALRAQKLPLIFLIASRSEQNIQLTFNSPSLAGLWKSLVLDDTYKPDNDIRTFLVDSFQEIKSTHPHHQYIPSDWPSKSNISHLIEKSSGQFIYASMVVKYISVPYDRPPHRLDVVMGLCPARLEVPFAELDALYMHLLESCSDPAAVIQILGVRLTGQGYATHIELLLSLHPGDVELSLGPLSAIINISKDKWISLSHASFGDFLTDMTRSGTFYIDMLTVYEDFISTCVAMLMNPELIVNNAGSLEIYLGSYIHNALFNIPLTDKVRAALMQLSLPHIWSIWEFQKNDNPQSRSWGPFRRMELVSDILNALKQNTTDSHRTSKCAEELDAIRQFHISSFQPIFESEFKKHYHGTELMHIMVIAANSLAMSSHPFMLRIRDIRFEENPATIIHNLLQLTAESIWIDNCTLSVAMELWSSDAVHNHFKHLWTPIPDDVYAQTVLRILRCLCNYPAHHIQFPAYIPSSKQSRPISRPAFHLIRYLHLRRLKCHQRGVKLSRPPGSIRNYSDDSPIVVCHVGLLLLPGLIQQSSKSSELAGFIRENAKKLPFIPNLTRKVIRAMHEYLARTQEDDLMDVSM